MNDRAPTMWVERLFSRFTAIYGNKVATMWGDCPKEDLMDAWGEALAGVSPDFVRDAISKVSAAYPSWPPTLGEFMALCKPASALAAHRLLLPAPRGEEPPPELKAKIDGLLESWGKGDPKRWAKQILREEAAGTYRYLYGIQCAREALGVMRRTGPVVDHEANAERAAIQGEA